MHIESAGYTTALVVAERRSRQSVREDPEVATTAGRDGHFKRAQHGRRELPEPAGGPRDPVGIELRAAAPVAIQPGPRKAARVVPVTLLEEHVARPFQPWDDREARRAVPQHGCTTHVLEQ